MTRGGCSRCPSPGGSRLQRVKPVSCLREEHTLRGVRRGLGAHGQSLLSSPRSTRFPVLPARSLRHADPAVRDASAEPRYPGEASRSPGRDPGPRASPRRPLPLSHTASPSCEGDGSPGAPSPRPTRSLASGSARGGRQCISGSSRVPWRGLLPRTRLRTCRRAGPRGVLADVGAGAVGKPRKRTRRSGGRSRV